MLQFVQTTRFTPALAASQRILALIHNGLMFHQETDADRDEVVKAADNLDASIAVAMNELAEATRTDSPFLRHRRAILARDELQQLVLFLFGGDRLSFFHLFSSTTPTETEIALRCIAHYAQHGERDDHFMRLAAEIHDLRKVAA